ncbi:MAG: hypothetical protein H7Y28_03410 [Rhodoferax sp.]|nr:hypothetical protein [Rhodoferax sp.]
MELVLVACSLWACAPTLAWAQETSSEALDARTQLEARKREQTAQFDAQEQACARTFAVTDCINTVNARRRAVVAALRKEENALNTLERHQREHERLQSLKEKARQKAEHAPTPADPSAESEELRLRRQQDKLIQHAPQSAPKVPTPPKTQSAIDAPTRQQNAVNFAARQQAAIERRAARDKKLKDQGKAPVDLPTP